MKQLGIILLSLSSIATTLICIEGARSIYLGGEPHQSMIRYLFPKKESESENHFSLVGRKSAYDIANLRGYNQDTEEFGKILPSLKKINAGLGNTDAYELITEEASILRQEDGCLQMKPNLDKAVNYIRTIAYEKWDPPVLFFDHNLTVPDDVNTFLKKYGFKPSRLRTNSAGQRITQPLLEREKKVLIVGDSVAMGMSVNDDETIASQLQKIDSSRQYINLGVGGAQPKDNFCELEKAKKLFPGKIDHLIYVSCDNDFGPDASSTPTAIIQKIKEFSAGSGAKKVTIVRAPAFFNVHYPLIYRDSISADDLMIPAAFELKELARENNISFLDIADLAVQYNTEAGSLFAYLAMFVDRVHLSKLGSRIVAEKLLDRRAI